MYTLVPSALVAPPRSEVLPLASRVKIRPGTASANSRKLRDTCGVVWICCRLTVLPTSEVRTSCSRVGATTVTVSRLVALALEPAAAASPAKFSVAVEATVTVTFCVWPLATTS